MHDVPSSAILTVIAIVSACLVAGIIFLVAASSARNNALGSATGLEGRMAEEVYNTYDSNTFSGRQVIAAIEQLCADDGGEVSVGVQNSDQTLTMYGYTYHGENANPVLTKIDSPISTQLAAAKKKGTKTYIVPSATYIGSVIRDDNTNAVVFVLFSINVQNQDSSSSGSGSGSGTSGGTNKPSTGGAINTACLITLDPNRGGLSPKLATARRGSSFNFENTWKPSDPGYTFQGWYTSKLGGTRLTIAEVSRNMTVYAHWEQKAFYTVSFDANGGSGIMSPFICEVGVDGTLPANHYAKKGMTFAGWNTMADGSGSSFTDGQNIKDLGTANQTITLYAQWEGLRYTVEYNANGGRGFMNSQTMTYGIANYLAGNTFTNTNMEFKEWNTKADGTGTSYYDGQSVKNLLDAAGTVTLYAQWSLNYTQFDKGATVNAAFISLAGGAENVHAIKRATALASSGTKVVSIADSKYPVYAWYNSGDHTIYWYSQSATVFSNKDMAGMFAGFTKMAEWSASGFDTSQTTNMNSVFAKDSSLAKIDISTWNTRAASLYTSVFDGCSALSEVSVGSDTTLQKAFPTILSKYWYDQSGQEYVPATIPVGKAGTYYTNNKKLPAILAEKDTWFKGTAEQKQKVEYINFVNEYAVTGLETATWNADETNSGIIKAYLVDNILYIANTKSDDDVRIITLSPNASGMFAGFTNVKNITGLQLLNTINVTDTSNMFGNADGSGCSKLTKIKGYADWNMASVTKADYMFAACVPDEINLSGWSMSSLTDASNMFAGTGAKRIMLGSSMQKLVKTNGMFQNAARLTYVNLSGVTTTGITSSANMFVNDPKLETVQASTSTAFKNAAVMFGTNTKLIGGHGTQYTDAHKGNDYAVVDTDAHKGYFTQYVIGAGELSAVLYDDASVSGAYTELTSNGANTNAWDTSKNRLLVVKANNLKIGVENKIAITVPAGLYIVKDSWTAAGGADGAVKDVQFNTMTNGSGSGQQNVGRFSNGQTGTLIYTITPEASQAVISMQVGVDFALYDKAKGTLITNDNAVTVTLDDQTTIYCGKVSSLTSANPLYTEGYGLNIGWGRLDTQFVSDDPQALSRYNYYLCNDVPEIQQNFKKVTIEIKVQGYTTDGKAAADANGKPVYAQFDHFNNMSSSYYGIVNKSDQSANNGTTTITYTDYGRSGSIDFGIPVYIFSESMGWKSGMIARESFKLTAEFYNGRTKTWENNSNTFVIQSSKASYADISVGTWSKTTANKSWYADDTSADCLGAMGFWLYSKEDLTDVTFDFEFDSKTLSGAPTLQVLYFRAPMPDNLSIPMQIWLWDETGKEYGPIAFTSVNNGQTTVPGVLASSGASSLGMDTTKHSYYLREVKYTIPTIPAAPQGGYYYGYGGAHDLWAKGVYAGFATKAAYSTMTMTCPDGTTKKADCWTNVTDTPMNSSAAAAVWVNNQLNPVVDINAGDKVTVAFEALSCGYPYGQTQVIKRPYTYIMLPDGVSIEKATFSKDVYGNKPVDANTTVTAIKKMTVDDVTYTVYQISTDKDVTYGGVRIGKNAYTMDNYRYMVMTLATSKDMATSTINLRNSIRFLGDTIGTAIGGAWTPELMMDTLDFNNNGKNDRMSSVYSLTAAINIKNTIE